MGKIKNFIRIGVMGILCAVLCACGNTTETPDGGTPTKERITSEDMD